VAPTPGRWRVCSDALSSVCFDVSAAGAVVFSLKRLVMENPPPARFLLRISKPTAQEHQALDELLVVGAQAQDGLIPVSKTLSDIISP
jgi:hypothetical protein